MLRRILAFYLVCLFNVSNLWANEFDSLMLWTGGGFLNSQSCETYRSNKQKNNIFNDEWIHGFEIFNFPAIEFTKGEIIDLNNSLWRAVIEFDSPIEAVCADGSSTIKYIVEIVPEDDEQSVVYLALSQVELYEVREFQKSYQQALEVNYTEPPEFLSQFEVLNGDLDFVVCTASDRLNVRDESLENVIFQASRHESVKEVQDFENIKKTKVIGGTTYNFIQMDFPKHANQRGWVAENFIKLRSECPGSGDGSDPVTSLDWIFPTIQRPSLSYKSGMRAFKASRGGGTRWHAACDLYRIKDEKVVAINSGKVIRGLAYFYQGTYSLEVKHSDGRIARYGEITGKKAPGVQLNSILETGQNIGYVGKVNSGCCTPMLHFELYSGEGSGPLTQSGNKFNRRWDLLDPTSHLSDWEYTTFGASY